MSRQKKVYWTTFKRATIQRAGLDGSNVEDLVSEFRGHLVTPQDIALDQTAEMVYWVEKKEMGSIQRASLDGSNMEEVMSGEGFAYSNDIDVDPAAGKIYWIVTGGKAIRRASLDGSNVEDVVTSRAGSLMCIALDVRQGKIYWVETGSNAIHRANLDGTGVENFVINGLLRPARIALDVESGKMYWTDRGS